MNHCYIKLVLLAIFGQRSFGSRPDISRLLLALDNLTWTNVNLIHDERPNRNFRGLIKAASSSNVYVKIVQSVDSDSRNVVINQNQSLVEDCIISSKPNSCLILSEAPRNHYKNIRKPRSFFTSRGEEILLTFTFRNQSTIAENVWQKIGGVMKYDLKGGIMTAIHKDWPKFASWLSCKDEVNDMDCSLEGIINSYLEAFKEVANLSTSVDLFHGEWGTTPKNGNWSDKNAFSGTSLEKIMAHECDFLTVYFTPIIERREYLSFSHSLTVKKHALFFNRALLPEDPDWTKFQRPFTNEVWIACSAIITIISCMSIFLQKIDATSANNLTILTFWLSFVFVFAYHNGALTMFFTSLPKPPASDMRGVMQSFPKWKLLIGDDEAIFFQPAASQGDPDYKGFWDRVQAHPNLYMASYDLAAQRLVHERGWVFFGIEEFFMKAIEEQSIHGMDSNIISFGKPLKMQNSFMLPLHSPFAEVINYSILKMTEKGVSDIIFKRRQSSVLPPHSESVKGLSVNDVILLFVLMAIVAFVSSLILAAEIYSCRFKNGSN